MQNVSVLRNKTQLPSCTVGYITLLDESGCVTVSHPHHESPVRARTTIALDAQLDLVGEQVLLLFPDDDPTRPVITGLLSDDVTDKKFTRVTSMENSEMVMAKDLDFSAANSVSIRCGKSQILMDKFGKIVIKGCNVLTRASSRNRIKGGSVSLN
ncbi:MAG: DUF6484 domain-containing protein [Granulosicoccus sp.]